MKNFKLILLAVLIGIYFSGCTQNDANTLKGTEWIYSVNEEGTKMLETLEFGSSTFKYLSGSNIKNDDELIESSASVYTGIYFVDDYYVVLTYDDEFKTNTISAKISESGKTIILNSKEFKRQK